MASLFPLRPGLLWRARLALAAVALLLGLVTATWVLPGPAPPPAAGALVARLGLSDLALASEARYTRHPALADRHAPFPDHPMALEHFPTGSVLGPPPHLRKPRVTPLPAPSLSP